MASASTEAAMETATKVSAKHAEHRVGMEKARAATKAAVATKATIRTKRKK